MGLRGAVLAADETDLLADYATHPLGRDDLEVHDRLLDRMGPHDRRRPHFAAHHDDDDRPSRPTACSPPTRRPASRHLRRRESATRP